jgi:hypothetical protein
VFERDGYVVVPGALDDRQLERVLELERARDRRFRISPDVTQYRAIG